MSPLEIWCNESQERYVMAVAPENLERFDALCRRERCPYAVIGEATEAHHLELGDSYFDDKPVDLPMEVLFGKPPVCTEASVELPLPSQSSTPPKSTWTTPFAVFCVYHRLVPRAF